MTDWLEIAETREAKATDMRYTPPEVTRVLLKRVDLPHRLYEPCSGDGWIARELRLAGHLVAESDIAWAPSIDFFGPTAAELASGADAIVTNPPWSDASLFVRRALELVDRVYMLLRLTFQEPCDDRADLLRSPHLRRVIVLPRVSFVRGASGTDSVPPAWFCWEDEPGPCEWSVVTKRELAEAAGQETLI